MIFCLLAYGVGNCFGAQVPSVKLPKISLVKASSFQDIPLLFRFASGETKIEISALTQSLIKVDDALLGRVYESFLPIIVCHIRKKIKEGRANPNASTATCSLVLEPNGTINAYDTAKAHAYFFLQSLAMIQIINNTFVATPREEQSPDHETAAAHSFPLINRGSAHAKK